MCFYFSNDLFQPYCYFPRVAANYYNKVTDDWLKYVENQLLAPHGAQAVIAFSHYYYYSTTTTTTTTIFSKYSPQISQNQCLEEASIGLCVGATP